MTEEMKYADKAQMEEALNSHPRLSYQIDNMFKDDPAGTTLFLKAKFKQLEKVRYGGNKNAKD